VILWSFSLALATEDPATLARDLAMTAYVAEFQQDRVRVAPDAVVALHQAACDAGYAPSCERSWPAGDQQKAATVLRPACDAGDHAACTVVAWAAVQEEPGRIKATLPEGAEPLALLDAACAAGIERACVEAGVLLTRGVEGEAGLPRAQQLFQTACQVGELAGCRRLGALYHSGQGVGRDLDKARQWYGKACEGGYAAGCNGLALIDHLGVGTPRDPVSAERNYLKACDGGHEAACENLVKLYRNGVDPTRDPEAALQVWTRGCERGVAAACANGGRLADDPALGGRDPVAAARLLGKGCDAGDPFTCGLFGKHLLPTEPDRGASLLETACAQGVAPACADLADALWSGEHVDRDKKRARALYTTACPDYEPACERAR
jgi:hypothetical protein